MTQWIHPGSLTHKVRQFFLDNPEEELTTADVALKFGCTRVQAEQAVNYLRGRKEVSTQYVIRRGPQIFDREAKA